MNKELAQRIIARKFAAHSDDQEWRKDAIISAYKMKNGKMKDWIIDWFVHNLKRPKDVETVAYCEFTYNAKLKDVL